MSEFSGSLCKRIKMDVTNKKQDAIMEKVNKMTAGKEKQAVSYLFFIKI